MSAKKIAKFYKDTKTLNISIEDIAELKAEELSHEFNLEYGLCKNITKSMTSKKLKNDYEKLIKKNVDILLPENKEYPKKIKSFYKNAPVLYVTGNKKHLSSTSVGVSGSREASSDGLKNSYNVAKIAVENNLTVVSGLARGVDEAAHYGAVSNGGNTVMVIPYGIDSYFLKANTKLYDEAYCVVSMFTPSVRFSKWTAVERNHLISSLSDILFIIEAKEPSGSLMQGKINLNFLKPTFVFDNGLAGNYNLIKKGATPVKKESVAKIIKKSDLFFPSINFKSTKYEVREIWEAKAV
jgi:DNA protecting protein DprA